MHPGGGRAQPVRPCHVEIQQLCRSIKNRARGRQDGELVGEVARHEGFGPHRARHADAVERLRDAGHDLRGETAGADILVRDEQAARLAHGVEDRLLVERRQGPEVDDLG